MTTPNSSMWAATARQYGPTSEIEVTRTPIPEPGPGEIRVRVRASSLNPLDSKLVTGELRPFMGLTFPAVLGFDLAGEVDAVAPDVDSWAVGDRVYGRSDRPRGAAHAELVVVSATVVDRIPERLSFEQAAALPLTGMTALQALRDLAHVQAGQKLLVHGASGGVGVSAVQIGKALGAEVTGTCGATSRELVESLGATKTIDYRTELPGHADRHDVVFDTQFRQPYSELAGLLAKPGVYVTTGFSPSLILHKIAAVLFRRGQVFWVISGPSGERMRALSHMIAEGKLEPVIDSVFSLEHITDGYEKLQTGHAHGKVVIRVP